jgi:hypothetical protein
MLFAVLPEPEKTQYDPDVDTVSCTASPKGYYKGGTDTFKGFEFVDQFVAHTPPRRIQLVRRYGAYSGKVRNRWQQRSGIYHLASVTALNGKGLYIRL